MLTPREGFDSFAAFLDRAGPMAVQWKRGLVADTAEITDGLNVLGGMLSNLKNTISREGWSRFDRFSAQVQNLIDTWHNDAVQDLDIGLGLDRVVDSGRLMLVQP